MGRISTFSNLAYGMIILLAVIILMPQLSHAADINVKLTTDKSTYLRNQTVNFSVYATYADGKPVTSISKKELSIKDSASVEVLKTSLVNKGNGYFSYSYVIKSTARTGSWSAKATIKDSSGNEGNKTGYFTVSSTPTTDTTPPVTSASPTGTTFTTSVSVTLTRNEAGTTYYTTNGTTPTTSSSVYSAPLTISTTTSLKFFSRDSAGNSEAVKTATYTKITTPSDTTPPVTSASPAGITFTTSVAVTLSRNEAGTTYYTTNGTTPTTSSAVYSAPLTISTTTTLKFFSRDSAGNSETVKTETYTKSTASTHSALTWTGYSMCNSCHAQQASEVFSSVHYQWRGPSGMTTGPAVQGKFSDTVDNSTAFNSYCINILGNWNGYSGCSNCHVGLGAKPTTTADAEQLDNIDCLLCHQKDYKRTRPITGGLYNPNTAAMTITMDQAVQTVTKPTRSSCLQCHAKGGGGDNFKRGDLTLAHGATADSAFDVHMATSGGNLLCQNCHATSHHKIAGRGSDLRPKDVAGAINCSTSTCHPTKANITSGHTTTRINKHIGRVSCQACHIRTYAKNAADTAASEATETHRTWQTSEWNATLNRYEPTITLGNNLTPKYSFWNGTSWGSNMLDTPVIDTATGAYKISRPNGAISDAVGTKLYPFKYKTSIVPLNTDRNKLVSVDTSIYFNTGNVADAINQGMVNMGFSAGEPYSWVTTDEYQLITHEVPPAAGNVLSCTDCHKNTARMNLPQMGYALKAAKSVVCSQCHGDKSYPDYLWVHDKHVTDKNYDCSFCHTFTRATERGLKTTK